MTRSTSTVDSEKPSYSPGSSPTMELKVTVSKPVKSVNTAQRKPSKPADEAQSGLQDKKDGINDIHLYIINGNDAAGVAIADCFITAPIQTPVTMSSLAELDMHSIINNPKLRHDAIFDRELHFRPNLDGPKGLEKINLAEDYWKALEGELYMYGYVRLGMSEAATEEDEAYWTEIRMHSKKRLPTLLGAIRDILQTLVPMQDRSLIADRLDVDLTMQEIQYGVCDLVGLGNWLGTYLKLHCAPMRDVEVNAMAHTIAVGAANEHLHTIVKGIRQLLNLLELMKLDVANHQMRHTRLLIVEGTVEYLRRHYASRLQNNEIGKKRARSWVEMEIPAMSTDGYIPTHLEALTSALLRGLLSNEADEMYPAATFHNDADRLKYVSSALRAEICHELILGIFYEVTLKCKASKLVWDQCATMLKIRVTQVVGTQNSFEASLENIAAEMMRMVLMLEGASPSAMDTGLLNYLEERLLEELRLESPAFDKAANATYERIMPKLQSSVARHIKLSAVDLQNALAPGTPRSSQRRGKGAILLPTAYKSAPDRDEDVVRRLTHIIVVHWQVFGDLVYLPTPDAVDPGRSFFKAGPSSPNACKVLPPLAEAVYGPTSRWIPIAITLKDGSLGSPNSTTSAGNNKSPGHSRLDLEQ